MPLDVGHHGGGVAGHHGFLSRIYNFNFHHNQNNHYNRPFIFRPWSVLLTVIFFSVAMVFLVLSLSLRSTYSTTEGDKTNTYTSRDMATITYSHMFCDGLGLKGSQQTYLVASTLYLLNNTPQITRKELISFAREITLYNTYQFWMFHLFPSSTIQLTACISSGSAGQPIFYLVKGASKFSKWKHNGYSIRKQLKKMCPRGKDNHIFFDHEINSDDQYYLIFESKHTSTTLKLTFNITQMMYNITQDVIISNCSVFLSTSDSCRLPVPLYNKPTAVLALQPEEGNEIDWEANCNVDVHCHPRLWLYVVVCLSGAMATIIIILILAGIIYKYRHCKHTTNNATRGSSSATSNRQVATAMSSAISPPENTPLLRFGMTPQECDSYVYKFEAPPAYKP